MYIAPSSSRSSMTCLSIMLKKMLNRVGARTQSCFTPLTKGKDPERLLFNLTWPRWSLCSWITILRNFWGSQGALWSFTIPFCSLFRSTNATYSPLFCSLHFSWSCLRMNTMSMVPILALNPHWVSGRWSSAMVIINLFRSTQARIFPMMDSRVIPQ